MQNTTSYYIIKRISNDKSDYLYKVFVDDVEQEPFTTVIEKSALRIKSESEAKSILSLLNEHHTHVRTPYSKGVWVKNTWWLTHVQVTTTVMCGS